MSGSVTLRHARIVLPDRVVTGDVVLADGFILLVAVVGRIPGRDIEPDAERLLGSAIDEYPWQTRRLACHLHPCLRGSRSHPGRHSENLRLPYHRCRSAKKGSGPRTLTPPVAA